jgi:hypothetical protein
MQERERVIEIDTAIAVDAVVLDVGGEEAHLEG